MALEDWDAIAANNTSVGGVNIAEGMNPGDVNNALRAIMADIAAGSVLSTTGNETISGIWTFLQALTTVSPLTFTGAGVLAVSDETILDDAVATIALPSEGTLVVALPEAGLNPANNEAVILFLDAGATNSVVEVHAGGNASTTTGVLTGTTGADTQVTYSVDTSGNLYIENRRGVTRDITVWILGGVN